MRKFKKLLLLVMCFVSTLTQSKIAILSYGSLVKWPNHSVTGAQLYAGSFNPIPLFFPISLSLLGKTDRITAVIDTFKGTPKQIWAALSDYSNLVDAIQNLAAREGALLLPDNSHDTQYIFYIRKIENSNDYSSNEEIIEQHPQWVIKNDSNPCQQLSDTIIEDLIVWAQTNAIRAAIWTSCPIVPCSEYELIQLLLQNNILLENAQHYVKNLPEGPQTILEIAIYNGKLALENLLNTIDN